jgi:hypothetical protein
MSEVCEMICPKCGHDTYPRMSEGKAIWACYACGTVTPRRTTQEEEYFPAHGPAVTTPTKRDNPEARIVQEIRKALISAGYRVYRCQQRRADFAGSDAGIGDLLVTRRGWLFTIQMDAKVPGGVVSEAQARACAEGHLFLVESAEDALAIAREAQRRIERYDALSVPSAEPL